MHAVPGRLPAAGKCLALDSGIVTLETSLQTPLPNSTSLSICALSVSRCHGLGVDANDHVLDYPQMPSSGRCTKLLSERR